MKAIKQVLRMDKEPYRVPKRVQDVIPIPNPVEGKAFQRAVVFLKGKGWRKLHPGGNPLL